MGSCPRSEPKSDVIGLLKTACVKRLTKDKAGSRRPVRRLLKSFRGDMMAWTRVVATGGTEKSLESESILKVEST